MGSDPNFEIALQRCITEILQGLSADEINSKLKPVKNEYKNKKEKYGEDFLQTNWLKCYTSNNGIHPNNFFVSNRTVTLEQLNFINKQNNIDAYNYIIDIIMKNNLELFVKDYSILGFNTYKVYIPSMSNVEILDELKLQLYSNMDYYKNAYYNFVNLKGKDNKKLEDILYKLSKSLRYSNLIIPYNLFGINHYVENYYVRLNYFYLYLIELIMNNKKIQACNIIKDKLKNENVEEFEKDYLEYLYSVLSNVTTKKKYSRYITNDVNLMLKDTKKYLLGLNVLQCPNCNVCNNRKMCKYKKWVKINKIFEVNSIVDNKLKNTIANSKNLC